MCEYRQVTQVRGNPHIGEDAKNKLRHDIIKYIIICKQKRHDIKGLRFVLAIIPCA